MKHILYLILLSIIVFASETVIISSQQWQDTQSTKRNWEGAKKYCQNLSLDGHNDWRLPNIKELQGIVDIKKRYLAIKGVFTYAEPNYYWSSSEVATSVKSVWCIAFDDGNTDHVAKTKEYNVRCVRSRK